MKRSRSLNPESRQIFDNELFLFAIYSVNDLVKNSSLKNRSVGTHFHERIDFPDRSQKVTTRGVDTTTTVLVHRYNRCDFGESNLYQVHTTNKQRIFSSIDLQGISSV